MLATKTRPMTDTQVVNIVDQAFDAAVIATERHLRYNPPDWFCGFAWVNIKPGNSKIAKYLVKIGKARKSYDGGVDVWNPGGSMSQSMVLKEVGAEAFASTLQKYGINAYAKSRAD